jgi:putative transposase
LVLAYSLSYRDTEELILKRGINIDHSTINRLVIHYAPLLEGEFRKNYKQNAGSSWRMDETYIKIKGMWHYLYRAVDKEGSTINFMLSKKHAEAAARDFFIKAIGPGLPEKATIDKSGANHAALAIINLQLITLALLECMLMQIHIRQIKYLNNIIEQCHRGIKRITKPMIGLKKFHSAEATLLRIELHRRLKKEQRIHSNNALLFVQFYALAA